jgi:hypothetical protein
MPDERPPRKRIELNRSTIAGTLSVMVVVVFLFSTFILPAIDRALNGDTEVTVSSNEIEPTPSPEDKRVFVEGLEAPPLYDYTRIGRSAFYDEEEEALQEATEMAGIEAQNDFFKGTFISDYHFDVYEFNEDGTFAWYRDLSAFTSNTNVNYGTYTLYPVARDYYGASLLDGEYITRDSEGEAAQTAILTITSTVDEDGVEVERKIRYMLSMHIPDKEYGDGFFSFNTELIAGFRGYVRFDENTTSITRLVPRPDGKRDTVILPWDVRIA